MGIAVWMIAALAGCHGVPITRVAPAPNRPQSTLGSVGRAALLPATVALDDPSEMASIDPSSSSSGNLTPSSSIVGSSGKSDLVVPASAAVAEPPAPTPLLDEALIRARTQGDLTKGAAPALARPPEPVRSTPPTEAIAPTPAGPEPAPSTVPAPSVPIEAAAVAPVAPEELWREGVRKLVGLARSKQEQAGTGAGTTTEPWGLRAQVLAWLAEPDIDPDLGQREADNVHAVLRALEGAASADPKKPEAHIRGDDVRLAVQTLEAKAPLELVDLRLCSKVERFGDFTPFDPPSRRAGDRVVIYCEVDGPHHEPVPGGFQTKLAGRMEIIPEGGGPTLALPLDTAEETSARRRRDYYIAYLKELPRNLPPGQYTLRLTLKDVFTDQSASRATPLTIVKDRENDRNPVASTPREASQAP